MGEAASGTASLYSQGILTKHGKGEKDLIQYLRSRSATGLAWAWDQFRLRWLTGGSSEDAPAALLPWVKNVLLVGWWSVVAVAVASVFFFGAIVGGFK